MFLSFFPFYLHPSLSSIIFYCYCYLNHLSIQNRKPKPFWNLFGVKIFWGVEIIHRSQIDLMNFQKNISSIISQWISFMFFGIHKMLKLKKFYSDFKAFWFPIIFAMIVAYDFCSFYVYVLNNKLWSIQSIVMTNNKIKRIYHRWQSIKFQSSTQIKTYLSVISFMSNQRKNH